MAHIKIKLNKISTASYGHGSSFGSTAAFDLLTDATVAMGTYRPNKDFLWPSFLQIMNQQWTDEVQSIMHTSSMRVAE